MTPPLRGVPVTNEAANPHAALRAVARQLEGVFQAQLFQAMRATVPQGGVFETSMGEELFTAMRDQVLAEQAAGQSERGLAEAIYRQLSRHLAPEVTDATGNEGRQDR